MKFLTTITNEIFWGKLAQEKVSFLPEILSFILLSIIMDIVLTLSVMILNVAAPLKKDLFFHQGLNVKYMAGCIIELKFTN
jgi:hypothetical protein